MYHPEEQFDVDEMAAFMRRPDIYAPLTDALAPPAEQLQFEDYMLQPTTWTLGCMWGPHIIGYVQYITRTSVMAEMIAGFHPQCRGKVAKSFMEYSLAQVFHKQGRLVVFALIASDNRPARQMAISLGFAQQGRIEKCITRTPQPYKKRPARSPGLYDLITYVYRRAERN